MQENNFMAVLLRKINYNTEKDLKEIFDVLEHDYDEIISNHLFSVINIIDCNNFDFLHGFFCGTISKVADKPVLTDLTLNSRHLF